MDEKRIRTVLEKISSHVPNISQEKINQVCSNLIKMKDEKEIIEKLAISLQDVFGNLPQFQQIYLNCLQDILAIKPEAFETVEDLLKQVEFNKQHNIIPGNMSIEENHHLINDTLRNLCNRLNELGVDYYVVGALSAFIGANVHLFRYHGDIDIMVAEKDLDKVSDALKDSDYIFQDNRLTTNKKYDPQVGHTQGEHEVIANHKENEFHIGFFLFDRLRDCGINVKEYYMGRKDGKNVPMVLERHIPEELVELEYSSEKTEYQGTSFRTSTPESVYSKKRIQDIVKIF